MSADRHKVYENGFTGIDILKARGASEKEIAEHKKKQLAYLFAKPKKK